jgi:tRNA A37 N6-isopentenylltransferase MiaA
MNIDSKVVAILGPTASGKSALAFFLPENIMVK